ncbi:MULTISPECIES: hypothetical protein [unclassified Bradyrhizobium]|uniref:hypothetical protein n=1 Tax=unclassified Bradyrhizobium TaxID=2631580 RepID=UPI0033907B7E
MSNETNFLEFTDPKNKGEPVFVDPGIIKAWFGLKDTGDTVLYTMYGGLVVRESIGQVKKMLDNARKKSSSAATSKKR